MSEYKEGDRVLVDAVDGSTGFVEVEITALEYNYFNDLRYRAGKRILHPKEIQGHAEATISANTASADPDPVNHPSHYGGDTTYEAIKVITAWGLGFDLGNVTKYVARAGKKDPSKELEDLRKARFYLEHRINQLEQNK